VERLTFLGDPMYRANKLLVPAIMLFALAFAGCATDIDDAGASDTRTPDAAPAKQDKVKHRTVRIKQSIPYSRDTVKTSGLDKGVTVVDQEGQPGVRVRVVRLTLKNGVEVGRDLVNTFVKQEPVTRVKLVGTHVEPKPAPEPASSCDPNYTGACVPVASDVDCAGGSGDGPEYVQGPVQVVGEDVYDLNRDDDSIACDS
jgi:hypothetical protein